jgi:3-oxosteroid 1-dehydrogenase
MTKHWDVEVDYLVVGTGAAGLSAALTAQKNGLTTLMIESTDKWGGTSAISGGGLWLPNNPLMQRARADDNPDAAFSYLEDTVGDVGPWTSRERKWAFINGISHFVNLAEEEGIRWIRAAEYPDYYPDLPGGRIGRSIEVKPFNLKKLPKHLRKTMRPPAIPAPVQNSDVYLLSRAWSTPDGFLHGARFVLRTLGSLITLQQRAGMGGALVGAMMHAADRLGAQMWINSPLTDLIVEGGRVVGATVNKEGHTTNVRAKRGVMLAAGGFARNKAWRKKYHGIEGWTSAPEGQLGQGIEIGQKVGGSIGMMDDAWWGATTANPDGGDSHGFVLNERSDPWSIVVDQRGSRYLNESESYVDFGHHMLEHHKVTPAIPSWMILDHRHTTHFLNSALMVPGAAKKLKALGELVEADTLEKLAVKMNVDTETFLATVERFNGFAKEGVDRDFQRGRTKYDRYYSNPLVKPNPNLGTIEKGPFKAIKLYPGDLGTKGGLVTDEWARVLDVKGNAIEGLYAAGNNTASVMGHTYPGPGSTIGPACVFGYLGALHASQQEQNTNS